MSILKSGLAVLAVTGMVAMAAPVTASAAGKAAQAATAQAGTSDATDFSSQRRRGRYVRRGPGPGAALAGAAAVGIIGSAIAAGAARDYYGPGPYYGPGYYGPGPQPYYGPGPGYYSRW